MAGAPTRRPGGWWVRDDRRGPGQHRRGRRSSYDADNVDAGSARVGLRPAAALFRSLGDPARLAIVRRLALGEARVMDLVAECGLAQSTVSAHSACLRECGLVASRPVRRASVFTLTQPALIDLLAAAETVLAAIGQAAALCPTYGTPQGGQSR